VGCCIIILAVVAGVIIAGQKGTSNVATQGSTQTTSDPMQDLRSTTTSARPGPPVSLPTVGPGDTIPGSAPCPQPDGSSPRTTGFTAPIPTCIDPERSYDATVKTTVGDMKFLLNPKEGVQTVNSFVFLAGYHYWDGAPLTTINPNVTFVVRNPVPGGPGYTVPNELGPAGTIFPIGRLAMVAGPNKTLDAGTFQVVLGEEAAGLPKETPTFGIMLDGLETLQAIRKHGSPSGIPTTAPVTITSIDISPSAVPDTAAPAP